MRGRSWKPPPRRAVTKGARELDAVWFMPNEGTASIYTHLALARYIQGDLAGAEAELKRTERRCESINFPQGVFSFAYACQMEVLIRIEAGQLDRAMEVATALGNYGAQHGFDSWAMVGAAQQETVAALAALDGNPMDTVRLQTHIATLTSYLDMWRALAVRSLITFYDAVLARLLSAAGLLDQARDRLQVALQLADESGMHFYDAELLRIRAHTTDDPGSQRAELTRQPLSWPGSRARIGIRIAFGARVFRIRGRASTRRPDRCGQSISSRQQLAATGTCASATRVKRPGGKVAIVGGGMAGLSTAWRLSEPGWQDRFESITVYQRGWRLGGKGASSRGANGRIEEHGLHIWLGSYENAFALLRESYAEIDRNTTDPVAPIRTWDQAMIPADNLGLADRWGSDWLTWLGTFSRNDRLPGDPAGTGREMTAVGFSQRSLQLVLDFADSQKDSAIGRLYLSTSPSPPSARTAIDRLDSARHTWLRCWRWLIPHHHTAQLPTYLTTLS